MVRARSAAALLLGERCFAPPVAAAGGSAERDEAAALTGAYLATIGEGKEVRGRIGRAEPLLPRFMTNVAASCRFSEVDIRE